MPELVSANDRAFITERERDLLLMYRLCKVHAAQVNRDVELTIQTTGHGTIAVINRKRNSRTTYRFESIRQGLAYMQRLTNV